MKSHPRDIRGNRDIPVGPGSFDVAVFSSRFSHGIELLAEGRPVDPIARSGNRRTVGHGRLRSRGACRARDGGDCECYCQEGRCHDAYHMLMPSVAIERDSGAVRLLEKPPRDGPPSERNGSTSADLAPRRYRRGTSSLDKTYQPINRRQRISAAPRQDHLGSRHGGDQPETPRCRPDPQGRSWKL